MTRLIHYSAQPLTAVRRREAGERCGIYKTPGLWVSIPGEDDWVDWCLSEQFGLDRLAHAAEVHLVPGANVKVIRSVDELDAFSMAYADPEDASEHRIKLYRPHGYRLDWMRLRGEFDGLIIPQWFWERRHSCAWYGVWDCASGVIWEPRCIDRIEAIEPPDLKLDAA